MSTVPESESIVRLLAEAGMPSAFTCEQLIGGRNNRVYRVRCGEQFALLKAYFQHPGDSRDRLRAEYAFCQFASDCGIGSVPRPLACDRASGLALYEFIEGRKLVAGEIGAKQVQQAWDFYQALNAQKQAAAAGRLGQGSEACFTLHEHLAGVDRRLKKLDTIAGTTPLQIEAMTLVRGRLMPAWQRMQAEFLSQAEALKLSLDEAVADRDRCLSPSDFGFHNAICRSDGQLRFIDFEYAGWDDPARMVCDFFSQPAVPVPVEFFASSVDQVTATLSNPGRQSQRVRLLLPVYRLKWCCLMLNEFLPTGRDRRSFAADTRSESQREQTQLQKATRAIDEIETCGVG